MPNIPPNLEIKPVTDSDIRALLSLIKELAISFYKKLGAESQEDWTTYRIRGEALDKIT